MTTYATNSFLQEFVDDGYTVARGLLSQGEVQELIDIMMKMQADGPIPQLQFNPVAEEEAGGDVLKQFPRIIHPHKVNATAQQYMIHPRIMERLAVLFGEDPLASQSMFYFKPPGARGQSLHQDNYFLKVEPGTCIAAWVALDPADQENGGLVVVPKTNHAEVQCPHPADQSIYFTNEEVDLPEGAAPVAVPLTAGDVLFFNGNVIHGSYPNTSQTRWRRSFIGHYLGASSTHIGRYYNDLYTSDGVRLQKMENTDAGPCGTSVMEIH